MSPKKGKVAGNSIATTTKKIAVAKKRDSARPGRISYPIVAIGASAGGFEAFNRLLRARYPKIRSWRWSLLWKIGITFLCKTGLR
jgi:hypothetical protein